MWLHPSSRAIRLIPQPRRLQPQHRRNLVRRPHLVSPQDLRLRAKLTSAPVHLDPPGSFIQRVQFLMSSGVYFYMSPDKRWQELRRLKPT
jgi:hypothetical protein